MGEFNRFVRGAQEFLGCVNSDKCIRDGMAMEFATAAEAAEMIEVVLKKNPDAYAAFRTRYTSNGRHVVSFGGTGMDGDPLSDPRKWRGKSPYDQLCDGIGLYFERQRIK